MRDIHWMAVRYADNRKSYAVGMCNDALRKAYDGGWLVFNETKQHNLDPQYARNGFSMLNGDLPSITQPAPETASPNSPPPRPCGETGGAAQLSENIASFDAEVAL